MQIKTKMRCHLIPARTAIIKKTRNNKCWKGCGEKGALVHHWWECKFGAATIENSVEVPQEIKKRTTVWSSNSTSGSIYKGSKKKKTLCGRDIYIFMFIVVLFIIAKTWKKPKCPSMDVCIKKLWLGVGGWRR